MTKRSNNMLKKSIGIFIAATVGFLLIAALGAYWAWSQLAGQAPPVASESPSASQTVKVFFGNANLNPAMMDCGAVYPVNREIEPTPAAMSAALEALLAGPTVPEQNGGYFTSINPGVRIKSLSVRGGVAKVDFDRSIQEKVGGSCRVSAIRAEITRTLRQFPEVEAVVISVEGDSREALQP